MKLAGIILITVGSIVLLISLYNFFTQNDAIASPIPEDKGMRVIFITPSKE